MNIQIIAIIALFASVAGFGGGYKLCDLQWESAKLEAIEKAEAERDAAELKYNKAATALIKARQERRIEYRDKIIEIPKYIDRTDCTLGDVGMQELGCAIRPSTCSAIPDGSPTRAAAPTEQ